MLANRPYKRFMVLPHRLHFIRRSSYLQYFGQDSPTLERLLAFVFFFHDLVSRLQPHPVRPSALLVGYNGFNTEAISGRRDPHAIDQVNAESNKISGCVFCVVNKDGKTLFEHASGKKGADTHAPMTLDSILWIAPCTKMLCGIAAMQLCEKGKVGLDDADGIEVVSPELRKIRVLKSVDEYGNTELVDRANRITLRMLTHTGKTVVILHHVWA